MVFETRLKPKPDQRKGDKVLLLRSFNPRHGLIEEAESVALFEQVLDLPIADFKPSYRGRRLPDVPPIRKEAIASIGFIIADKIRRQCGVRLPEVDELYNIKNQGRLVYS